MRGRRQGWSWRWAACACRRTRSAGAAHTRAAWRSACTMPSCATARCPFPKPDVKSILVVHPVSAIVCLWVLYMIVHAQKNFFQSGQHRDMCGLQPRLEGGTAWRRILGYHATSRMPRDASACLLQVRCTLPARWETRDVSRADYVAAIEHPECRAPVAAMQPW